MARTCCPGMCRRFRKVFCTDGGTDTEKPSSLCGRIFFDGTTENTALKQVIGFASGCALSFFLLWIATYSVGMSSAVALPVTAVLGLGASFALATSRDFRCVAMLAVPGMFTGRGRDIVTTYIMVLILTGPVKNLSNNVLVASESLNCVQDAVKDAVNNAMAPLRELQQRAKNAVKAVKDFAADVQKQLDPIVSAYQSIGRKLDNIADWLDKRISICEKKYGGFHGKCQRKAIEVFNGVYNNSPWYSAKRIGSDCLDIGKGFLSFQRICREPIAKTICSPVYGAETYFCSIDDRLKVYFKKKAYAIKKRMENFKNDVKDMLYFDVDIETNASYQLNQTRTEAEVRGAIRDAILRETSWIRGFLYYVGSLCAWFTVVVLVSAAVYRRKYMTKDEFDNVYITTLFREMDATRRKMGRSTALPLRWRERRRYVTLGSPRMSPREKKELVIGLVALILRIGHMSVYIAADYGLWWTLDRIRLYHMLVDELPVRSSTDVEVSGSGSMATMYSKVSDSFDPSLEPDTAGGGGDTDEESEEATQKPSDACLPLPTAPDLDLYRLIGLLLFGVLWMHLGEAYALRFRPVFCSWFYPERARLRAAYLYNQVLMQRGNFLAAVVRDAIGTGTSAKGRRDRIGVLAILLSRVTFLRRLAKLLGYVQKYCSACGVQGRAGDMVHFEHCDTFGCKGIYCNECRVDLGNNCVLCSSAIKREAGDVSEETDSSGSDTTAVADDSSPSDDDDNKKTSAEEDDGETQVLLRAILERRARGNGPGRAAAPVEKSLVDDNERLSPPSPPLESTPPPPPQLSTTSLQPSITSPQPSITSRQPITMSPQPSTTSPQPSITSPQPSTTSPPPSTMSHAASTTSLLPTPSQQRQPSKRPSPPSLSEKDSHSGE